MNKAIAPDSFMSEVGKGMRVTHAFEVCRLATSRSILQSTLKGMLQ